MEIQISFPYLLRQGEKMNLMLVPGLLLYISPHPGSTKNDYTAIYLLQEKQKFETRLVCRTRSCTCTL